MMVLEWVRTHRVVAALLSGAAVGILGGATGMPAKPLSRTAAEDAWALPPPAAAFRVSEAEFATVRAAPIWGGGSRGADGVKPVSWRLTGIIGAPQPAALVAPADGSRVLQFKVGDVLPDGAVIESIGAGTMVFMRDGCRFQKALYAATAAPLDERCAPAAAPAKPSDPRSK